MRGQGPVFIDSKVLETLKAMTREFLNSEEQPDSFLKKVKDKIPVEKTDPRTWKSRVEGMYEVSDLLFQATLDEGQAKHGKNFDRSRVVNEAQIRPMSYYHWATGSREPVGNLRTRDDFMNDPTTALVKLEDDIVALAKLYRRLGALTK